MHEKGSRQLEILKKWLHSSQNSDANKSPIFKFELELRLRGSPNALLRMSITSPYYHWTMPINCFLGIMWCNHTQCNLPSLQPVARLPHHELIVSVLEAPQTLIMQCSPKRTPSFSSVLPSLATTADATSRDRRSFSAWHKTNLLKKAERASARRLSSRFNFPSQYY